MTGCARSEGYYKIDMREKVKYLPHHRLKNTSATTPTELKKNVSWVWFLVGVAYLCVWVWFR